MRRFLKVIVLVLLSTLFVFGGSPVQALLANEYFYSSNNIETFGDDAKSPAGNFVYYDQSDSKWATHAYGNWTIGPSGCGPTSLAMIVATLVDPSVTPVEVADLGTKNNSIVDGVGTIHLRLLAPAASKWGFKYSDISGDSLDAAVAVTKAGGLVYLSGTGPAPFTGSGHIVVMRGETASGDIIIADPYGNDPFLKRGASDTYPRSVIEANRGSTFGVTKL